MAGHQVKFKYNENKILQEIKEYIESTYNQHYVGKNNVQAMDLILAGNHATGFNIGNILKYANRFGEKEGFNRKDLLKVVHYAIFELYNQSRTVGSEEPEPVKPELFYVVGGESDRESVDPFKPGTIGMFGPFKTREQANMYCEALMNEQKMFSFMVVSEN